MVTVAVHNSSGICYSVVVSDKSTCDAFIVHYIEVLPYSIRRHSSLCLIFVVFILYWWHSVQWCCWCWHYYCVVCWLWEKWRDDYLFSVVVDLFRLTWILMVFDVLLLPLRRYDLILQISIVLSWYIDPVLLFDCCCWVRLWALWGICSCFLHCKLFHISLFCSLIAFWRRLIPLILEWWWPDLLFLLIWFILTISFWWYIVSPIYYSFLPFIVLHSAIVIH